MILYLSNSTDYSIFDSLLENGMLHNSYQMQKFNSNLISGLGKHSKTVALSALPYNNIKAPRIDRVINDVRFIAIKNYPAPLHKITNLISLSLESYSLARGKAIEAIVCDAISISPCIVGLLIGKIFKIPVVGIVTDLPGMLGEEKTGAKKKISWMRKFDAYVLLTQQMNDVVNTKHRPWMVMEGLASPNIPERQEKKHDKKIIMYTGSLWRKEAGIEYLVNGFIRAELPNCELHFYGSGELVPYLKELGQKYPSVKYMGCVSNAEIVKLQSEADLLVNPRPSDQEFCKYSFPSKTIEYMLSGTPVLMTKLPGVPEEYYKYVYCIDHETPDGIAEVMKKIFKQTDTERLAFGGSARNFIVKYKNCDTQSGRVNAFCKSIKK